MQPMQPIQPMQPMFPVVQNMQQLLIEKEIEEQEKENNLIQYNSNFGRKGSALVPEGKFGLFAQTGIDPRELNQDIPTYEQYY